MLLQKNNQIGATMVEMLGVLTIVTMLGVSAIKLVGNLMGMFKQNLVVNQIRDLQKSISGRYRFEGNYETLLKNKTAEEVEQYLCSSKLAAYDVCLDGKLIHRMGGKMWVTPAKEYDAAGNVVEDYSKYVLDVWGLTDRACISAAQINWYQQNKSDVYRMVINAGKGNSLVVNMPYNAEEGSSTFPVSANQAMKACKGDDNDIQWVFF